MSRLYDRLRAYAEAAEKAEPARVPRAWERISAASEAEVREDQEARLTKHYVEHQIGPLLVLLRGGYSELIRTQDCPDCQRYGRWWDMRGTPAAHDILLEMFRPTAPAEPSSNS